VSIAQGGSGTFSVTVDGAPYANPTYTIRAGTAASVHEDTAFTGNVLSVAAAQPKGTLIINVNGGVISRDVTITIN
jgi:hypothetical protein